MSEPRCPDQKQLLEYLSGRLDRQQSDHLSDHIDTCANCNATISTLNPGADALVGGLQSVVSSSFVAEPECAGVVQQIAAQSPTPMTSAESSTAGTTLIGEGSMLRDYRLFEQIGRGGMGAVHRAEHVRLKRPVAIKLLLTDRLQDDLAIARFNREMEAVGKLDHPNIVRATDAGDHDGTHFLVMELVDGPNLSQIARTVGPLRVADACELVRQAAEGLQHAYEHGLVHRDIKPSNLLLADGRPSPSSTAGNPTVKILDLGLALLRENPTEHDELTSSGQIMGTLDYMAPEQASDTHGVDIRADLYSLGCTLYHLLAGSPPFSGSQYSTILKKMMAHAQSPVPPLSNVRSDVPPELQAVLDGLLAKEPSERYGTPAEVAAALLPFVSGAQLPELLTAWRDAAQSASENSSLQSTVVPVSSAQSDTLNPVIPQADSRPGLQPQADVGSLAPTIMADQKPSLASRLRGGSGSRRRLWQALTGFGGILLLGIVFFVGTGEGRVELTVNHKDIQVSVDGAPHQIRVMDGVNGEYRIELPNIPAGRRELIVTHDGFSAETRHFWITRGGTRAIEIKVSPPTASDHSISDQPFDGAGGELSVAKWVLSLGGKITTDIKGSWMTAIPDLPQEAFHIEKIEVPGASVTDADIARLRSCSQLATFACGGSSISDDGLKRLSELKLPLTFLAIHSCGISDEGLRHLKSMKTLSSLTFTATRIGDSGIATLAADHPMLTSLFVGSTAITDTCVPALAKLTSLKRLHIDRTRISPAAAERLKAALPDTLVVTDGGSLAPLSELGTSYALRFQGNHDRVSIPTLALRDDAPLTFEAYIRIDALPKTQHQGISLWSYSAGAAGDDLWLSHDGKLSYRIDRRRSVEEVRQPGQMSTMSVGPLPLGRWVHVAAVRDGSQARLYVDGELLSRMSVPPAADVLRTGFTLGQNWHDDARYGDIQMGWVRISRLPRYRKDFMPGVTGLADGETVALYLFDSGQGEILRDASKNGFDGVIEGAKWVDASFDASRTVEVSPENRDRLFAQWVLDRGGKLHSVNDHTAIKTAGDAPASHGNFSVDFSALPDFGDDDLRAMNSLRPSRMIDLILRNTSVTDRGLAKIEGFPCWKIDLADTAVTDKAAAHLATMPGLHHLMLSGTKMTGACLKEFRQLPELVGLRLDRIPVTDEHLQALDGCDLLIMELDENAAVSDESMSLIGKMTRMGALTLPKSITDEGLQQLSELRRLTILTCSSRRLSDASADVFESFTQLERLNIRGTGLADVTLDRLNCENSLRQIALDDCRQISPEGLGRLKRFRELRNLLLSGTNISNQHLSDLAELPHLTIVELNDTGIDDDGLSHLMRCKSLTILEVSDTQVTPAGIARLREALPNCDVRVD